MSPALHDIKGRQHWLASEFVARVLSVLGWARSTALDEFSSCCLAHAGWPWPLVSSHTGKVAWCRGRSSAFVSWWDQTEISSWWDHLQEIRPGTGQSAIFTKPLMMCNVFLGGGLEWGWRPQVCSKIQVGHITMTELGKACTNQAVLWYKVNWVLLVQSDVEKSFPGNARIIFLFTFW